MKPKMVSYTLETLPKLTDEDLERLKKGANRPDSQIDTSDIPEVTEEQWRTAVRGHFYLASKEEITFQLDAAVLKWLKSQDGDYESRINAILRREMLSGSRAL